MAILNPNTQKQKKEIKLTSEKQTDGFSCHYEINDRDDVINKIFTATLSTHLKNENCIHTQIVDVVFTCSFHLIQTFLVTEKQGNKKKNPMT